MLKYVSPSNADRSKYSLACQKMGMGWVKTRRLACLESDPQEETTTTWLVVMWTSASCALTYHYMHYRSPEIRWWWWWPFVQYGSLALHHNIAPCRPTRQFPVRVVQHDMHWKLKRHRAVQQQSPSRRRWTNRLVGQRSGLDMKKEVFGQQAYVQEVGRNKQEAEMQLFCCLIHSLILCKRRAT